MKRRAIMVKGVLTWTLAVGVAGCGGTQSGFGNTSANADALTPERVCELAGTDAPVPERSLDQELNSSACSGFGCFNVYDSHCRELPRFVECEGLDCRGAVLLSAQLELDCRTLPERVEALGGVEPVHRAAATGLTQRTAAHAHAVLSRMANDIGACQRESGRGFCVPFGETNDQDAYQGVLGDAAADSVLHELSAELIGALRREEARIAQGHQEGRARQEHPGTMPVADGQTEMSSAQWVEQHVGDLERRVDDLTAQPAPGTFPDALVRESAFAGLATDAEGLAADARTVAGGTASASARRIARLSTTIAERLTEVRRLAGETLVPVLEREVTAFQANAAPAEEVLPALQARVATIRQHLRGDFTRYLPTDIQARYLGSLDGIASQYAARADAFRRVRAAATERELRAAEEREEAQMLVFAACEKIETVRRIREVIAYWKRVDARTGTRDVGIERRNMAALIAVEGERDRALGALRSRSIAFNPRTSCFEDASEDEPDAPTTPGPTAAPNATAAAATPWYCGCRGEGDGAETVCSQVKRKCDRAVRGECQRLPEFISTPEMLTNGADFWDKSGGVTTSGGCNLVGIDEGPMGDE